MIVFGTFTARHALLASPEGLMRTACALWFLTALLLLRGLRQWSAEFLHLRMLAAVDEWFFDVLPHSQVVACQLLILLVMVKIDLDFTRQSGWCYRSRRSAGRWLLACAGALLAMMVARDVVRLSIDPEQRWTVYAVPTFEHRIGAVYVLLLGLHHWRVRIRPPSASAPVRGNRCLRSIGPAVAAIVVAVVVAPWARFSQQGALLSSTATPEIAASQLSFRNDAAAFGGEFRYFAGVSGPRTHRIFEFTGGGVGILDYDVDGWPDVWFTQGRNWPPNSTDEDHSDRFLRNGGGKRFDDVTTAAGIVESGFGQGVTIGDVNADGFPDVYVANIGTNTLWTNVGDGTFIDTTIEAGLDSAAWTTSCVLVDVTGDGLPDIYDVNYLTGDDVFDRVCQFLGRPITCRIETFEAAGDELWRNTGDGRFFKATTETLDTAPTGKGLGVAAWDAFGEGKVSLLVLNDTTPNFFFTSEPADDGSLRWRERGSEVGLAFNGKGQATGCMGGALGDVDDDGRLDILITNFQNEPNTLYLHRTAGMFEDHTRELGLHGPSLTMLGFGAQFLDVDRDGRLELFVANGHVDDVSRFGQQFRMPAQLFRYDGRNGFDEVDSRDLGPYFQQPWIGRAVARLDWNRDRREDLIVGHLDDNYALLTNTTLAGGEGLSLSLIGVQSNRDAIGASVRARVGDRWVMRQLTAGDGYQCSNERRLVVGTGDAKVIDELEVQWPSGAVQRFFQVPVAQHLVLREGGLLQSTTQSW